MKVQFGYEAGVWCGLCLNPAAGEYKGWPIEEDERRAVFDRVG